MKLNNTRRQRGFGMMEISAVLTLMALALGGGVWLFHTARTTTRIQQEQKQIVDVYHMVRKAYMGAGNYWDVSESNIIDSGVVPDRMVENGQLVSASGRWMNVYGGASPSCTACGNAIRVSTGGYNRQECVRMAQADYGPNLISIRVAPDMTNDWVDLDGSETPDDLMAVCEERGPSENQSLKITFQFI